jgi:hypothetical protein
MHDDIKGSLSMATRAEVESAIATLYEHLAESNAQAPVAAALRLLSDEYRIAAESALRLERIIHELIKAAEEAGR